MKIVLTLTALLMLAGTSNAKVACSPDVSQTMCSDVAAVLNPSLDHGILPDTDVPVEIVTAKEYAKRLSNLNDDEVAAANKYGAEGVRNCATCFSPWNRHTLNNSYDPKISFLRDRPASHAVARILISAQEFEGFNILFHGDGGEAKVNGGAGEYNPGTVHDCLVFIAGYLSGSLSTLLDGAADSTQLDKVPH